MYKYANLKPWDPAVELREYEYDGLIGSITKPTGINLLANLLSS